MSSLQYFEDIISSEILDFRENLQNEITKNIENIELKGQKQTKYSYI